MNSVLPWQDSNGPKAVLGRSGWRMKPVQLVQAFHAKRLSSGMGSPAAARQCWSAHAHEPSGALNVKAAQACRCPRTPTWARPDRRCARGRFPSSARRTDAGPHAQVPREEGGRPTQASIGPARRLRPQDQCLTILLGCCRDCDLPAALLRGGPWYLARPRLRTGTMTADPCIADIHAPAARAPDPGPPRQARLGTRPKATA